MLVNTTAIIFQNKPLFENERHLLIFSRDLGRCYVLAKPSRTKKNVFHGQFEACNVVNLVLFQGRNMLHVNHCDILKSHPHIRQSFQRIALVYYFFDLVIKSTGIYQHQDTLFDLLVETLEKADDLLVSDDVLMTEFHYRFLAQEGLLAHEKTAITPEEFSRAFEDYTNRRVRLPSLSLTA